jgi:hypothetical protein
MSIITQRVLALAKTVRSAGRTIKYFRRTACRDVSLIQVRTTIASSANAAAR